MVKIRLKRMGAKKNPFYRVVVADSRYPRDGRFIEEIGTYDPTVEPAAVKIDMEKANKWIANGAQPTETVRDLLKRASNLFSFKKLYSLTYKSDGISPFEGFRPFKRWGTQGFPAVQLGKELIT